MADQGSIGVYGLRGEKITDSNTEFEVVGGTLSRIAGQIEPAELTGTKILGIPSIAGITVVSPATTGYLAGVVQEYGTPVSRTVRAYRRDTGELLGSSVSSAGTGAFRIDIYGFGGEVFVVAFDDNNAPSLNAKILDRISPV